MDNNIKLNNGIDMPCMGLGTYPMGGKVLDKAVLSAIDCGYRLFDTAHNYPNEKDLGNSLKKTYKQREIKRSDIFITSKIGDKLDKKGMPIGYYFYNSSSCQSKNTQSVVKEQFHSSLRNLQTDYLDLLLIHWPYPDYLTEIWNCLEELYKSGKVRAIGVSNCLQRHIEKIAQEANILPMVNQINVTPLNTQKELLSYCRMKNIVVESYSPLIFVKKKLNNDELNFICEKHNKSFAQVILRWNIQNHMIPIAKSANFDRLNENFNIFDFQLSNEEMNIIDSINENITYLPGSKYCPGY